MLLCFEKGVKNLKLLKTWPGSNLVHQKLRLRNAGWPQCWIWWTNDGWMDGGKKQVKELVLSTVQNI